MKTTTQKLMNLYRLDKQGSRSSILGGLIILVVTVVGFFSFFYFFNHIQSRSSGVDLHAHFLIGLGESQNWPNDQPHWLFFSIIRWVYHTWGSRVTAYNCFLGILAVSSLFKYFFLIAPSPINTRNRLYWRDPFAQIIAIGVLVCMTVPIASVTRDTLFLGYIVPTTLRSSTTIASIPAAILLFFTTRTMLQSKDKFLILAVCATFFEVLLVQIKPSYLLAFIPGLGLFSVGMYFFNLLSKKRLLICFVICTIGALSLLERQAAYSNQLNNNGFEIINLTVWLNFVENNPIKLFGAVLSSVALPIIFIVESKLKNVKIGVEFWFAFIVFVIAIIQYSFFGEAGEIKFARNMIWQGQVAATLVHMVVVTRAYATNNVITLVYFFVEVLVGLNYIRLLLI